MATQKIGRDPRPSMIRRSNFCTLAECPCLAIHKVMAFRSLADWRYRSIRLYNWLQFVEWRTRRLIQKSEVQPNYVTACPSCFKDEGLRLLASKVSVTMAGACPACKTHGDK